MVSYPRPPFSYLPLSRSPSWIGLTAFLSPHPLEPHRHTPPPPPSSPPSLCVRLPRSTLYMSCLSPTLLIRAMFVRGFDQPQEVGRLSVNLHGYRPQRRHLAIEIKEPAQPSASHSWSAFRLSLFLLLSLPPPSSNLNSISVYPLLTQRPPKGRAGPASCCCHIKLSDRPTDRSLQRLGFCYRSPSGFRAQRAKPGFPLHRLSDARHARSLADVNQPVHSPIHPSIHTHHTQVWPTSPSSLVF